MAALTTGRMTIRLYCDEDSMGSSLVAALRSRGIDMTTALEDDMVDRQDGEHLDHATRHGRVLFSFNRGDYFQLHTEHLMLGKSHAGIILANQQHYSVGELMRRILRLSAARMDTLLVTVQRPDIRLDGTPGKRSSFWFLTLVQFHRTALNPVHLELVSIRRSNPPTCS